MRVLSIFTAFASASTVFAWTSGIATYNTTYDNKKVSTNNTACYVLHGRGTHGYKTVGDFKTFPFVGGAPIKGWDPRKCGTCYLVKYTGTSVLYTAISESATFTTGLGAMNKLTGLKVKKSDKVKITYQAISPKECGL